MLKRIISLLVFIAAISAFNPTVKAAVSDEIRLYSFNFDDGSDSDKFFSSGKSVSIEWVGGVGIGYGDKVAIKVVHTEGETYNSAENAVVLNLPEPLPAGGVYRIVAWVYAASDENPGKGTLIGPGFVLNGNYPGEQGVVKFPPEFGTLPFNKWKVIDVTLPLQEAPISRLDFRIVTNEEPKHPDVWYCDNIDIYRIGELEEVAVREWDSVSDLGYPVITRNKIGSYDEFDYELWTQRSSDPVSMTLTGGGTFQCDWDAQNVLFRTGKKLGSTKTYEEYGEITMEYEASHDITKGDVSYLCVYGWTENPMIEFYVIENHGNYKPPGGVGFKGTYKLDGGTYEVYVNTRAEQPSIQGTKTFDQYFAVRTDKRTEGTISVSKHFKAWEKLGLNMAGKMFEVALCAEGYNSSGNVTVSKYLLTIGDTVYGTPDKTGQ